MPRRGENIRKRKDGRWEGRYQIRDSRTGKTCSHSVYAKTYSEIKEKLSVAKKEYRESNGVADLFHYGKKEVLFDSVASEWFQHIEMNKKHSTCVKYRNIYENYIKPCIGNTPITAISQEKINSVFPASMEVSGSILKSISCVTNQIVKYAAVHYNIACSVVTCNQVKKVRKPVQVLTKTEQGKLMRYLYRVTDIHKVGIILCLSTGLRLGEICALKWEDIDLEGGVLYVNRTVQRISVQNQETKTTLIEDTPKSCFSKREIPLTDELIKLLKPYKKCNSYVLGGNKPMEPRTYQNKFAKYLELSGVRKTNFHILRHTFATNCIDSGTDIKSLSEILGHSDVRITLNRYVHPTTETKRRHMNTLSVIYGQYVGQICV